MGLIGFSDSKWDVHFDDIQVISNDIDAAAPIINNEKTSINFGGTFKSPGDVFEFNVDVVNAGTIDAMLNSILKTGITSDNSDYINYEVKYYDSSEIKKYDFLGKNSRTRINVKVEFKYEVDSIPTISGQNFTLTLEYVSSTDEAVDRGNTFLLAEKNDVLIFNNAKENSLSNLRIYGNNEQKQYSGYQLIQKDGLSTSETDSEFWNFIYKASPLSDGWAHIEYDNTNGSTDVYPDLFINNEYINLKPSTTYTYFLEYKNFSGEGSFVASQSVRDNDPFTENFSTVFNSTSGKTKKVLHTKDDLTGKLGLRSFAAVNPGKRLSIDVRIMLVEGDYGSTNLEYEPYVGGIPSPNPDYSQEINSVTGDSKLTITGKNLFRSYDKSYNSYGITTTAYDDGSLKINGTVENLWVNLTSIRNHILEPGTYTFSMPEAKEYTVCLKGYYPDGGVDEFRIEPGKVSKTFTIKKELKYYIFLHYLSVDTELDEMLYIQVEKSDKATEYEPFKNKVYDLSLGDIKLNGIGDNRDYIHNINGKWFIHKAIEKQIFDGSEEYKIDDTVDGITQFSVQPNFNPRMDNEYINYVLSDRFRGMEFNLSWLNNNTVNSRHNYYLRFNTNKATTIQEFKTLLSNNNTTVYYVLDIPIEIEITNQELISQLNAILENNLYDGYNYINFDSNINTDISFDYKQK